MVNAFFYLILSICRVSVRLMVLMVWIINNNFNCIFIGLSCAFYAVPKWFGSDRSICGFFRFFFHFNIENDNFFMWHNNKMKMNVYTPIRRRLCNRVNGRTISLPFCLRWSQFKPPRVLNNSFFLLKRTMNLCANPFIRRRLKTCFFFVCFFFG